jgi:hypothetical protein
MSGETETSTTPFRRYLVVEGAIMLTLFVLAVVLGWEEGTPRYLLPAFFVGLLLSILYLLMEIASSVEQIQKES